MGIVYLSSNVASGKLYVGITINSLSKRITSHKSSARRNIPGVFNSAIRKYGPNAFEWSILEECDNENLLVRESFWADFLNTFVPNGYNLSAGSGNISEEVRKRMSDARRGKPSRISDAARERLKSIMIGNKYSSGHYPSDETRLKLSIAQKSRRNRESVLDKKPCVTRSISVRCENDGEIYDNMVCAAAQYSIGKDAVRRSAQNNSFTKGGLRFSFVEAYQKKEYRRAT